MDLYRTYDEWNQHRADEDTGMLFSFKFGVIREDRTFCPRCKNSTVLLPTTTGLRMYCPTCSTHFPPFPGA